MLVFSPGQVYERNGRYYRKDQMYCTYTSECFDHKQERPIEKRDVTREHKGFLDFCNEREPEDLITDEANGKVLTSCQYRKIENHIWDR